jgi:hypothetical protein
MFRKKTIENSLKNIENKLDTIICMFKSERLKRAIKTANNKQKEKDNV